MSLFRGWLLIMGVFVLGALFGGYLWVHHDQTALSEAVAQELGPLADHQKISRHFIDVAAKVLPSVVSIGIEQTVKGISPLPENPWGSDDWPFGWRFPWPREYTRRGLGSGVIVSRNADTYYILTNSHVVAEADKTTVGLYNELLFDARLVGTDPNTDIAVISIEAKGKDLPLAELGDSGRVRVGELVLAVGAPHGLTQTVTHGIISAKGRTNERVALLPEFLQTDAPINPGNSGGPLVDMGGRVIGINTWISSQSGGSQGLGFAIPINLAAQIQTMLIEDKKITRAYLGVTIAEITDDDVAALKLKDRRGSKISRVFPDSPAAKAGLRAGDVVAAVDGQEVTNYHSLLSLIAYKPIGSTVTLDVVRDGKTIQIKAILADATAFQKSTFSLLGLAIENLTPQLARQFHHADAEGVIITGVEKGSPAERAGLRRGMLVLKVADKPVRQVSDLSMLLEGADLKSGVVLYVQSVEVSGGVVITRAQSVVLKADS